jgi:hypothetical protein
MRNDEKAASPQARMMLFVPDALAYGGKLYIHKHLTCMYRKTLFFLLKFS